MHSINTKINGTGGNLLIWPYMTTDNIMKMLFVPT